MKASQPVSHVEGDSQSTSASRLGELALIAGLRRKAARHAAGLSGQGVVRLGIGDDCAILRPSPREELVITTDLFLEKVHFRLDWHQPEVAGHRCLARGLSDIAAMGATPAAAFLSYAVPPELTGAWLQRFLDGLLRLARKHNLPLAGGDSAAAPAHARLEHNALRANQGRVSKENQQTAAKVAARKSQDTRSGALFTADIILVGSVPRGKALLRSGARPGDSIHVTGALGGAAAELALLEQAPRSYARLLRDQAGHPHLFPQPRIEAGSFLRRYASAAIDISDGIATDLNHVCEESGVAAEIELSLLPIHALATSQLRGARKPKAARQIALELALHGGEDYELLFTAPAWRRVPDLIAGTPVIRVGSIVKARRGQPRMTLVAADGSRSPLDSRGWEHFRSSL